MLIVTCHKNEVVSHAFGNASNTLLMKADFVRENIDTHGGLH